MSSLIDEVASEQALGEAKVTINGLLRQLDRAKASKEELVAAVYRAVADNIKAVTFDAVPTPGPGIVGQWEPGAETAVVVFSDLQLGQVSSSFNSAVAEQRVKRFGREIRSQVELRRASRPVRDAKVYLLGDLVEGELIFPHQPFQIDQSLFSQSVREGPRIIGDFLRELLTFFDHIDVVSVPGNHGDVGGGSRKAYNPETNFDRILSSVLEQIFAASGETRITFRIPSGYGRTSFYAVDYVGDIGFMLWHGHQAQRTSSSSHLPFYKLVMGWRSGAIPEPFSVSLCGHHHTPTMLTMNSVRHFINGTFASDSEYAVERLAANSRAAQWLLFAKPGKGITGHSLIDLDD